MFNPVAIIWNGTLVSGPILIYHDEITFGGTTVEVGEVSDINATGALVCRSQNEPNNAAWRNAGHYRFGSIGIPPRSLYQIKSSGDPSFARVFRRNTLSPDTHNNYNGLFTCRVGMGGATSTSEVIATTQYIGLYARGEGEHRSIRMGVGWGCSRRGLITDILS